MKRKGELESEYGEGEFKLQKSLTGGSWQRGPLLGKGGFGSVYLAVLTDPGPSITANAPQVVAVKSTKEDDSEELWLDKCFLDALQGCPYIVTCFGEDFTVDAEDEEAPCMANYFMEYASQGTLADLINKSECGLPEEDARRFTRMLLEGLDFVHKKGIVHCDIKPQNILLAPDETGSLVAKIADFGLAKSTFRDLEIGVRGTAMYLAPESIVDEIQLQPSDVWALGCVVLNMLTRRPTWKLNLDEGIEDLWKQIASAIPSIPDGISHLAKDFLLKCFVRNPEERSSVGSLLYHPFVNVVLHDMPESEAVVLSSCAAASSDLEDKFKEDEVEEVYDDDIMEEDPCELIEEDPSELIEEDPSEVIEEDPSEIMEEDPSEVIEEDPSEIEIGNQETPVGSSWASKEAVEAAVKLFNSARVDNIIALGSAVSFKIMEISDQHRLNLMERILPRVIMI